MAGQRRRADVDLDVLNSKEWAAGLQRAVRGLEHDSEDALTRTAIRVVNAARELCPVDTGRLRSSVTFVPGRDGIGFYVDVGTNVAYAPFVEFGTSTSPAQPFLRPALAEAAGYIGDEVRRS